MRFTTLCGPFAICRLDATAEVPGWGTSGAFSSITRTANELSVICEEAYVPADVKAERGFQCIQLEGPFAFQETGILESFLAPLARSRVPVFALSTYDTDWILIQKKHWENALVVLSEAGHELVS
jgi:hypothetical protein